MGLEKLAQNFKSRDLSHRLYESFNLSGKALESFFDPEFKKIMTQLRQIDDAVRNYLGNDPSVKMPEKNEDNLEFNTISIDDSSRFDFKDLLNVTEQNLKNREYMSAVGDLGRMHNKLGKAVEVLKHFTSTMPGIEQKILFKDLDDDTKKYLEELKTRLESKAYFNNYYLVKNAGILDWFGDLFLTDRGRALKEWEKRFPKQFNELKKQSNNIFDQTKQLVSKFDNQLRIMSYARAARNPEDYAKAASELIKDYAKYDINFRKFYNDQVKGFLEKANFISPAGPDGSAPPDTTPITPVYAVGTPGGPPADDTNLQTIAANINKNLSSDDVTEDNFKNYQDALDKIYSDLLTKITDLGKNLQEQLKNFKDKKVDITDAAASVIALSDAARQAKNDINNAKSPDATTDDVQNAVKSVKDTVTAAAEASTQVNSTARNVPAKPPVTVTPTTEATPEAKITTEPKVPVAPSTTADQPSVMGTPKASENEKKLTDTVANLTEKVKPGSVVKTIDAKKINVKSLELKFQNIILYILTNTEKFESLGADDNFLKKIRESNPDILAKKINQDLINKLNALDFTEEDKTKEDFSKKIFETDLDLFKSLINNLKMIISTEEKSKPTPKKIKEKTEIIEDAEDIDLIGFIKKIFDNKYEIFQLKGKDQDTKIILEQLQEKILNKVDDKNSFYYKLFSSFKKILNNYNKSFQKLERLQKEYSDLEETEQTREERAELSLKIKKQKELTDEYEKSANKIGNDILEAFKNRTKFDEEFGKGFDPNQKIKQSIEYFKQHPTVSEETVVTPKVSPKIVLSDNIDSFVSKINDLLETKQETQNVKIPDDLINSNPKLTKKVEEYFKLNAKTSKEETANNFIVEFENKLQDEFGLSEIEAKSIIKLFDQIRNNKIINFIISNPNASNNDIIQFYLNDSGRKITPATIMGIKNFINASETTPQSTKEYSFVVSIKQKRFNINDIKPTIAYMLSDKFKSEDSTLFDIVKKLDKTGDLTEEEYSKLANGIYKYKLVPILKKEKLETPEIQKEQKLSKLETIKHRQIEDFFAKEIYDFMDYIFDNNKDIYTKIFEIEDEILTFKNIKSILSFANLVKSYTQEHQHNTDIDILKNFTKNNLLKIEEIANNVLNKFYKKEEKSIKEKLILPPTPKVIKPITKEEQLEKQKKIIESKNIIFNLLLKLTPHDFSIIGFNSNNLKTFIKNNENISDELKDFIINNFGSLKLDQIIDQITSIRRKEQFKGVMPAKAIEKSDIEIEEDYKKQKEEINSYIIDAFMAKDESDRRELLANFGKRNKFIKELLTSISKAEFFNNVKDNWPEIIKLIRLKSKSASSFNFFNMIKKMSNEHPLVLKSYIIKHANLIRYSNPSTFIKLIKVANQIRG